MEAVWWRRAVCKSLQKLGLAIIGGHINVAILRWNSATSRNPIWPQSWTKLEPLRWQHSVAPSKEHCGISLGELFVTNTTTLGSCSECWLNEMPSLSSAWPAWGGGATLLCLCTVLTTVHVTEAFIQIHLKCQIADISSLFRLQSSTSPNAGSFPNVA